MFRPTGIYSLDRIVDAPFVHGVAIRPKWSDMEPNEGEFDFSMIEEALEQAEALGQSVSLANVLAVEPPWLLDRVETWNDAGKTKSVPWDISLTLAATFLLEAQAERFQDHPALLQVATVIPGINGVRIIDLPPTYTHARMQATILTAVTAWSGHYPGKFHYLAWFGVHDDPDAALLVDVTLSRFPNLNLFQEFLTGQSPDPTGPLSLSEWKDQTGIMFQACGPWTQQHDLKWEHCDWVASEDSPEFAFRHATEHFGTTYFEFYPDDLENPEYRSIFERWSEILFADTARAL